MSLYSKLRDELINDPLGRGYAGMDAETAANSLNTENRDRNRTEMSGREVMDAFNANGAEWDALATADQDRIISLCGRGQGGSDGGLNPFGNDAKIFQDAAAGATGAIAALATARVESISRATELGLPEIKAGHVEYARS